MAKALWLIGARVQEWLARLFSSDPDTEVVWFDAGVDGVLQMVDALRGDSEPSFISLAPHGSEDTLPLGATPLSLYLPEGHAHELVDVSSAFPERGNSNATGMISASAVVTADTVWEMFRSGYEFLASVSAEEALPIGNDHLGGPSGDEVRYGARSDNIPDWSTSADFLRGNAQLASFTGYISIPEAGCKVEVLIGGEGNGTAFGGAGDGVLYGGKGTDITEFSGADPDHTSVGLFGGKSDPDPTFVGLFGSKSTGTSGNDTLSGSDPNDWVDGREGDDLLYGGRGDDTLFGGAGNDYLRGDSALVSSKGGGSSINEVGSGADSLTGGDGDDTLLGGAGNDVLYGGKGTDVAEFSGAHADYVITPLYWSKNGAVRSYQVSSAAEGVDFIGTDVEYLRFSDREVMLEPQPVTVFSFSEAGSVTAVSNPGNIAAVVSEAIHHDMGGIVLQTVVGTTIDSSNATSSTALNVRPPIAVPAHPFVDMPESGMTSVLVLAADAGLNAVNIDLVGLPQSAVEFV